jgi:hypothetical protein
LNVLDNLYSVVPFVLDPNIVYGVASNIIHQLEVL